MRSLYSPTSSYTFNLLKVLGIIGRRKQTDKAIDNAENKYNYAIAQSSFPPLAVLAAGKAAANSPVHTIPVVQRWLKDKQMAQRLGGVGVETVASNSKIEKGPFPADEVLAQ